MTEQQKRLAEFAASKVGCGYIYGATGWICSLARRQQQASQYPDQAHNIINIGAKWDGRECYDCAQLVRHAVAAGGGYLPSGANSQYNKSLASWVDGGPISTMPEEPVIVYRLDAKNVAQHTGIYIGGGDVVDARGTADGVIRSKLSSHDWTHWRKPLLGVTGVVDWEEQQYPCDAIVRTKTGKGIGLWGTASTSGTKIKSVPEGGVVTVLDKPAVSGFAQASYGGSTGYCDTQYLFPVDTGADQEPDPEPAPGGSNTFELRPLRFVAHPAIDPVTVETLGGQVIANDGDYIVEELPGGPYVVKYEVFRQIAVWAAGDGSLREI